MGFLRLRLVFVDAVWLGSVFPVVFGFMRFGAI